MFDGLNKKVDKFLVILEWFSDGRLVQFSVVALFHLLRKTRAQIRRRKIKKLKEKYSASQINRYYSPFYELDRDRPGQTTAGQGKIEDPDTQYSWVQCQSSDTYLVQTPILTPSLGGPSLSFPFLHFSRRETCEGLFIEAQGTPQLKGPHNCDYSICTGQSDRFFSDRQQHFTIQTSSIKKNMSNQHPPQPTPHQQTFINIANSLFHIQPYPWQFGMGNFAIQCISNNQDFKFICIRPTGGGKSLLYQVLALYVKGVTLCITPILALGSDQM